MTWLLITVLSSWAASAHDFHASITQIEYNEISGRFEIAAKMFTDDLELAIRPDDRPVGELLKSDSLLVANYLKERLRLKVDGSHVMLAFLGCETENDATWCYLESGPYEQLTGLSVRNTVLLEVFDDQVNIIHFTRDGKTNARMTSNGESEVNF